MNEHDPGAAGATMTIDEAERRSAYWEHAREVLGLSGTGEPFNVAVAAVDRHAHGDLADARAMRFIPKRDGEPVDYTYGELAHESDRIAAALAGLGVAKGDVVGLLGARVPLLYLTALGAWKAGAVVAPLFAAFGPEPIRQRLELGHAKVLVTTESLNRRKIVALRDRLPDLQHVVLLDRPRGDLAPGTSCLPELLHELGDVVPSPEPGTTPVDPALLHFTSGTTGTPKGAVHVHGALVGHLATASDVFALGAGDRYWCTADPGWVTGTCYGILAPLASGASMIVDEADFDAERWYGLLESERVNVWYTAPTAIRMLMRAGGELPAQRDLSALRLVASVGEPLDAEAVRWGIDHLGMPIRDTWWQTETGAIMIANVAGADVVPGSMGRPVDGVTAGLLDCDDEGGLVRVDEHVVELDDPERIGMIAFRPGWPSMFQEYLGNPERYAKAFADGWYLSGDLARRDADGRYWFVGRADDVIKTAGHLIGPFEVEQLLVEHPDVVGAGVYGVPDPVAGQVIRAEIVLRDGAAPDDASREEVLTSVLAHARRHLGAALAPREIVPVESLPYTRSGKVMRRLLRARALGLPEGDTSTLETPAPEPEPAHRGGKGAT